ncbi:hypothetical protein FHT82_004236 [Rhizobium sp. BK275]|uniref:hypothetical protein n=1 Tax=unclassified Rhizobium TaxID=2613769 RepID=UPI001610FC95|nr:MULTISPECIES: hypothetical protein [unclassified Rhizobium]MBB3391464.1 hypothetical protein [Rhizobium sp. BK275]MBB3412309.1 hypothetical protein [Rhizobium sp. BK316]
MNLLRSGFGRHPGKGRLMGPRYHSLEPAQTAAEAIPAKVCIGFTFGIAQKQRAKAFPCSEKTEML